ncbi:IS3 family transposase [Microbulbifer sp. CAU 1566]|uniref:IS3 family transposase n=1 Tax=Microbulbifer sp. CAU 1566 TaxID=2933269 RepID=UPI00249D9478|nr:IS3 family transposase [Microbulbifer sp. CAU 1566]
MIREHVRLYPIRLMCRCLEVSASGYYRWLGRGESERAIRREHVTEKVKDTFEAFKARYGAPRIARELADAGIPCSTNYIAGIMHKEHIRARNGKGFRYSRAVEGKVNVAANLLKRCFEVDRPNCRWTSDITYIWVRDRWLYLAAVMDLYSRRIVGWALDTQMTEELTQRALKMALEQRGSKPGLIVHSDRGVQYRAQGYQDLLLANDCRPSMSRQANCWDNAAMESFFSRLKVELVYAVSFENISQAKSEVFEYIEIFYNRVRRHSTLGYKSPAEYERKIT